MKKVFWITFVHEKLKSENVALTRSFFLQFVLLIAISTMHCILDYLH